MIRISIRIVRVILLAWAVWIDVLDDDALGIQLVANAGEVAQDRRFLLDRRVALEDKLGELASGDKIADLAPDESCRGLQAMERQDFLLGGED